VLISNVSKPARDCEYNRSRSKFITEFGSDSSNGVLED
jgi:hypothetical protein